MKRLTRKVRGKVIIRRCYTECLKEAQTGMPGPVVDCAYMQEVADRLYSLEEMIAKGELVRVSRKESKDVL